MAPFKEFTNWNNRFSDNEEQVEPYRKYYFLCEGENTERWYFEKLINDQKVLKIHPSIDIRFLERTGEDSHVSHPKRLLEYANALKEELKDFDQEHDKFVIVFDSDIYNNKQTELMELIKEIEAAGHLVAMTNPSFELFLLLHIEKSFEKIISKEEKNILDNKKVGNQRCIASLLRKATGWNAKRNEKIGELYKFIDIEIEQEKLVNQNIYDSQGRLTCNLGKIIESIRRDGVISD